MQNANARKLDAAIVARTAVAGVIGLGYVGLPLAAAIARAGFTAVGFDIDPAKIEQLNGGHSYIDAVPSDQLAGLVRDKRFRATADFAELGKCDIVAICVPTPLTRFREPDLSFVTNAARDIAKTLRKGQLVVLESTTYPGTTTGIVRPILEERGLKSGEDFFLGFSPEREDPGNTSYKTVTIPKVVAGHGAGARALMERFYGAVVERVVPVSSPDVAEAVKITENVFRAVNIALVNELKLIYDAMGIDVWEVIDAAATKPFGYMPFYPGPGLGGHCIPIDPFYLTWASRAHDLPTRFIELAGEINVSMPLHVVNRLDQALDRRFSASLNGARVLILGLAYKKNVSDIRESPTLKLMEILEERGAKVDFHDPHVPEIPRTREHPEYAGRHSVALTRDSLGQFRAVIVATDHDAVDYNLVSECAALIVDTRNAFARRGLTSEKIVKA